MGIASGILRYNGKAVLGGVCRRLLLSDVITQEMMYIRNWHKDYFHDGTGLSITTLYNSVLHLRKNISMICEEFDVPKNYYSWFWDDLEFGYSTLYAKEVSVLMSKGIKVWCIDDSGFCLIGHGMNQIQHINELLP